MKKYKIVFLCCRCGNPLPINKVKSNKVGVNCPYCNMDNILSEVPKETMKK